MTLLRPVVVSVLRQELAAVQRERGPERRRRLRVPRSRRRRLERVDVDVGSEREHLVAHADRVRSERAACNVHRLVEVVRGRGRSEVAPQHVHCLVAVQPVPAGKRKQLHELARLLQTPRGVGDGDAVDRSGESAEQAHIHRH